MSGGYFDYVQYSLENTIEVFDDFVKNKLGGGYHKYSEDAVKEILTGLSHLEFAATYLHRIDWLLSGDDGEETFLKRLEEDLDNLWEKWRC
mgnify:CR=1 FL=1